MSDQLKRAMESGSESDMDAYLEIHSAAEIIRDIRNITGKKDDLRDHFAGLAMQALISMPESHSAIMKGQLTCDDFCGSSYEWADKMLAARKGGAL